MNPRGERGKGGMSSLEIAWDRMEKGERDHRMGFRLEEIHLGGFRSVKNQTGN